MEPRLRTVVVVLFDGFELLDAFGPVEILSRLPESFSIMYVGPRRGPVRSSQGATVLADQAITELARCEVLLVPGGPGTRSLAEDTAFLAQLHRLAGRSSLVTSVCTGSALLAAAGILDGYRATSNKRAFTWASGHGDDVTWVRRARWVEDRDRWTSSGVAAGMDMTAALVRRLLGAQAAEQALAEIELEVTDDSDEDPFADRWAGA